MLHAVGFDHWHRLTYMWSRGWQVLQTPHTLEPQLEPICEWIDKAREEGGKVLVHCRVGVSRSATVTVSASLVHGLRGVHVADRGPRARRSHT